MSGLLPTPIAGNSFVLPLETLAGQLPLLDAAVVKTDKLFVNEPITFGNQLGQGVFKTISLYSAQGALGVAVPSYSYLNLAPNQPIATLTSNSQVGGLPKGNMVVSAKFTNYGGFLTDGDFAVGLTLTPPNVNPGTYADLDAQGPLLGTVAAPSSYRWLNQDDGLVMERSCAERDPNSATCNIFGRTGQIDYTQDLRWYFNTGSLSTSYQIPLNTPPSTNAAEVSQISDPLAYVGIYNNQLQTDAAATVAVQITYFEPAWNQKLFL
jgi:hypothetical protein